MSRSSWFWFPAAGRVAPHEQPIADALYVQGAVTTVVLIAACVWYAFSLVERAKAERRTERIRAATYAKRFAAKEAAAKALGTGFRAGVFWRDLGVVNLSSGQPTLRMTGGAADRLRAITPPGHAAQVALTMTDEYPYAQAMVIISAVPLPAALGRGALP